MKRRNFDRATKVAIVKRACAKREDGQPNCEICGAIGCKLEVHHKDMDAMQIDKSRKLTAEDGLLLCEPCHDPITSKQRKELAKAQACEAKELRVSTAGRPSKLKAPPKERKPADPFPGLDRPQMYKD